MFQLALLLFCVPLQLSVIYFGSNIQKKINEYFDQVSSVVRQSNLGNVLVEWSKSDTAIGTSYDTGDSSRGTVRSHRPEQVFLRVGFVVLQIQLGYTGVIVGWRVSDDGQPIYEILTSHPKVQGFKTEAPQTSLYPLQYTYVRSDHLSGYCANEKYEKCDRTSILHPELENYFEGYDGATQYIPLPWLRNLYPLD